MTKKTRVKRYTRKDGTHVKGHTRMIEKPKRTGRIIDIHYIEDYKYGEPDIAVNTIKRDLDEFEMYAIKMKKLKTRMMENTNMAGRFLSPGLRTSLNKDIEDILIRNNLK